MPNEQPLIKKNKLLRWPTNQSQIGFLIFVFIFSTVMFFRAESSERKINPWIAGQEGKFSDFLTPPSLNKNLFINSNMDSPRQEVQLFERLPILRAEANGQVKKREIKSMNVFAAGPRTF